MLSCRDFRLIQQLLAFLALVAGSLACTQPSLGQQLKARVTQSPGGPTTYVPGKWGTLQLQLTNLTDEPAEIFAATFFEDDPGLQYCRQSWVPAKSRLQISHPILAPANPSEGWKGFNFRTILLDPRKPEEVLIRGSAGDLQLRGFLRQEEEALTAIIDVPQDASFRPEGAPPRSQFAYELAVTSRTSAGLGRRILQMDDEILPVSQEAYASLDHLIIADNRTTSCGPSLAAIRRWLYGGGHLWVLLDRVDPKLLEQIVGDDFTCQVVDRVGLTTVRIEPTSIAGSLEVSTQNHEEPVNLVRLEALHVDVAYTVNGWPAAFWKQCGDGKLLVTTLAPEGWMRLGVTTEMPSIPSAMQGGGRGPPRPGRASTPAPSAPSATKSPAVNPQFAALLDGAKGRSYSPLSPLKDLAAEFFSVRNEPLLPATAVEPHVQEYIGKPVPSRWLITSLLAGFGIALAVMGSWMWRRGGLEWLGVAGPCMAVGVSAILLILGRAQRQAVPSTIANVQFIQPVPGSDDFLASGLTGIYSPDARPAMIASRNGGWLFPERSGQDVQTVRLIWTDLDTWEWKNLPLTSGLRRAPFSIAESSVAPVEARATFGPEGITGRLSAAAPLDLTDAILATREGRMGVEAGPGASFRASATSVFSLEQFLAANLLSDEQNRRRRTLMQLLANPQRLDYPSEPKLLVWASPLDLGFTFDQSHRMLGAALVAVPLALERPPPGTEVAIASPFLPYRGVNGPDGLVAAGLWDHRRREWQDRSLPSSIWLRFQVPEVLLPLEPLRGHLTVQVAGPVGKLEVSAARGKDVVPLKTWMDPVGTLSLDVSDPTLLPVAPDGGLLLKISGGDPARPELTNSNGKASYWHVESLRLDLHARTTPSVSAPSDIKKE